MFSSRDGGLKGQQRHRARLRAAVAAVERELLRLPRRTTSAEGTDGGLFDSWAELVNLLALGPAPRGRRSPNA
jgi:hypothetical protein